MSININDLSHDLLAYIFDFLSIKESCKIELVCKKWDESVRKSLARKESLSPITCYKQFWVGEHRFSGSVINNHNIECLKKMVSKCPNINSIDLSNIRLNESGILLKIAKLFPKLKKINLHSTIIYASQEEVDEFARMVGPQLTKCNLLNLTGICCRNIKETILKQLKNIEWIKFTTYDREETLLLFHYLYECENLKRLYWAIDSHIIDEKIDLEDEKIATVFQRINYFKTGADFIYPLRYDLSNLTQLKIAFTIQIERYFVTFPNVIKLTVVIEEDSDELTAISGFRFPKLEFAHLKNNTCDISTNYFQLIQNVKSLKCEWLRENIISSLQSLDNLVNFTGSIEKNPLLYDCIDALSQHDSVQNIQLKIFTCDFNETVFEKIKNLCQAKSDAKIKIHFDCKHYTGINHQDFFAKFTNFKNLTIIPFCNA